jgi:sporulation protein YlmC with PRC-barrel domain
MIGKLMLSSALVLVLSGSTFAANTTMTTTTTTPAMSTSAPAMGMPTNGYMMMPTDALASKLIGMQVFNGTAKDAQQIGTIKDLVIDHAGKVMAAVIGVGGFLGVGEKDVAINYPQLKWTTATADNSPRMTLATTKEALTAAPAFKYPADNGMAMNTSGTMNNGKMPATVAPVVAATAPAAAAPATGTDANSVAMANSTTNPAPASNAEVNPAKLTMVAANTMKSDDLKGTDVISPTGEKLGSIGDFVLTKDGRVDAVVVDFGGFLGIGTKQVAIAYKGLKFLTDQNKKRYVEVDVTKSQLNAQQAYNKDTYATDRAEQRLTVSS